jgi:hypothetical protein
MSQKVGTIDFRSLMFLLAFARIGLRKHLLVFVSSQVDGSTIMISALRGHSN